MKGTVIEAVYISVATTDYYMLSLQTLFRSEQGLRSTGQRRAIIESFFAATGHATIEELLEIVRKKDTGIGYATVYRTMKMLAARSEEHTSELQSREKLVCHLMLEKKKLHKD